MQALQNFPPVRWALRHPRIAAWVVLSAGMVVLLVIEARDVGLTVGNWIALIVATILVAGACIWIVSWEDADEVEDGADEIEPPTSPTSKPETGENAR